MAGGKLDFWLFIMSLLAVLPYGVGFPYSVGFSDIKKTHHSFSEDDAKAVWDNSGFSVSRFLNGTPTYYMGDCDKEMYYDSNLGLHHGICYSMVEVIYNTTSRKAKEYETCCRPLQQDPDEDPTTECICEEFLSVPRQLWKDLSKVPMPSCWSRKEEERSVPDMTFISYTVESGDPKFETRLWKQPFYIILDGLEVCPEDPIVIPIVIPWIAIYISITMACIVVLLWFYLLRQILRQKKTYEVQDIELGDCNAWNLIPGVYII